MTSGVQYFPAVIPPSTVLGRLAQGAGPVEAIPNAALAAALTLSGTVASNIAALKGFSVPATNDTTASVLGYYVEGDGGGGLFRWNSTDTTADNGGTVIIPNSAPGTGRWNRVTDGTIILASWFGMMASQTAAVNTTAINAALALAKTTTGPKIVLMPAGVLNVNGFTPPGTSAISADTNGITLKGVGNGYQQQANPSGIATTLKFAAGITSGLGSTKIYGIYQDNSKHWMNFQDFGIDGNSVIDYGLRICTQATYRRLRATNCNGHGFRGQTLDSTECELLVAVGNVGGGMLIDKATSQDSVNTTPNTTANITGIFSGNGTTGLEIQQLAFSRVRAICQNNLTNGLKSVNLIGIAWMQWCELFLWLEGNGNGSNPQILFDSGDASGGPQDNIIISRIDPLSTNTAITITKGQRNRFYRTIFTDNATGAVSLAAGATDNVFEQCRFSDGNPIGGNITDNGSRNYLFGEWKTPAFSAGNFTANGAMTWTVASGNVATYEYVVFNKKMTLAFSLNTTTVGGTPNTDLRIAIPSGFLANKTEATMFVYSDNAAAEAFGTATTAAGVGFIALRKGASIINTNGNWAAATNTTYVYGNITFEVQ